MRRIPPVLVGAVVALLITAAPALAIWPTTCVEANDAFEYSAARRHENVGIYQRVFGNAAAAEAACRNDHRGDIQGAFGWALQDGQPQPTGAAAADGEPSRASRLAARAGRGPGALDQFQPFSHDRGFRHSAGRGRCLPAGRRRRRDSTGAGPASGAPPPARSPRSSRPKSSAYELDRRPPISSGPRTARTSASTRDWWRRTTLIRGLQHAEARGLLRS